MKQLNRFAVGEHLFPIAGEGVGGPRADRQQRRLTGGRAEREQHGLVSDDRRPRARGISRHAPAARSTACLRQCLIAADVVEARAGVEDVADRLVGELTNRGEDFVRVHRSTAVNHQDAVVADLRCDVGASPFEQIDIAPHRNDANVAGRRTRRIDARDLTARRLQCGTFDRRRVGRSPRPQRHGIFRIERHASAASAFCRDTRLFQKLVDVRPLSRQVVRDLTFRSAGQLVADLCRSAIAPGVGVRRRARTRSSSSGPSVR